MTNELEVLCWRNTCWR